ncbi:MAG: hypothetical protein MJ086_03370 [Lachnospiraceae bacterium]|nr:hypothetical protein [Lachnospiraceae bacterium]
MTLGQWLTGIKNKINEKLSRSGDEMSGRLTIKTDSSNQLYIYNTVTDSRITINNNQYGNKGLYAYDAGGTNGHWIIQENSNGEVSIPIAHYSSAESGSASVSVPSSSWKQLGYQTFPQTGIYIVDWAGRFNANATGQREIAYSTSASLSTDPNYNNYASLQAQGSWPTLVHLITIINVTSTTQKHYIHAYQNSGSNLSTVWSCKFIRLGSV